MLIRCQEQILNGYCKKVQPFDRTAIRERFFSCFAGETPTEIAKHFNVTPPTVFQWLSGHRHVPWEKLKYVVDMKGMRWDWLLDGKTPEMHDEKSRARLSPFDWEKINQRFFALFPNMSQTELAKFLGVTQGAVCSWSMNRRHIPWGRLRWAVAQKNVTWEWLLEGR